MRKDWNKLSVCVVFTFAAFTWFSTCDIGLGSSVDTQAPSLAIDNPVASSVYTGDILVDGTWNDDKGVVKIDLTVKDNNTGEQVGEVMQAEISADKKWTYTLHTVRSTAAGENDFNLPDGSYEVNVTAYDVSGHSSGLRSRSFTVDSTAPVFVVSKPNSLNINDPAAYGRSVQITGTVSEDNGTKAMKVEIFRINDDGTETKIELAKDTFTGFDYVNPSVTIAKFFVSEPENEDDRAVYENYRIMYGLSESDEGFDTTKKYYAVVKFIDNANNESDKAYIGSNLKSVFNEQLRTSLDDYATLKTLLNGSYSGSLTDEQKAKAIDILNGTGDFASNNYLANSERKLAFTINSRANPTYSLDYYYTDMDAGSFSTISRQSLLNIEVNAGLDKDAVKPDSLRVHIYEINTVNFEETEITS